MLATALVGVKSNTGEIVVLKALIDQGSQSAFISENAMQTLKLKRNKIDTIISGIGEREVTSSYTVNLEIVPRFKSSFILKTEAVGMTKLTKSSADISNDNNAFEHLKNVFLADPSYKLI